VARLDLAGLASSPTFRKGLRLVGAGLLILLAALAQSLYAKPASPADLDEPPPFVEIDEPARVWCLSDGSGNFICSEHVDAFDPQVSSFLWAARIIPERLSVARSGLNSAEPPSRYSIAIPSAAGSIASPSMSETTAPTAATPSSP
jgi:hypothetical protein